MFKSVDICKETLIQVIQEINTYVIINNIYIIIVIYLYILKIDFCLLWSQLNANIHVNLLIA